MKSTIIRLWLASVCFLLTVWGSVLEVNAGLQDNPYVTFSPDGEAFTTNADETNTVWYENGYTVYTGKSSTLREPETGEHLYNTIRKDHVPVKKWVVSHPKGQCIHEDLPGENYFHGVQYDTGNCFRPYYSGWIGYCADCEQKVVNAFFYMSDQAALSLTELDMSLAYYYRCPWCTNLEMGVELKQHSCRAVSANQYSVRYHANYGSGYMMKSTHMYNNVAIYEGNAVIPQKNLTLNSYTRDGYEFIGWNTEKDGSGRVFQDGQEILNLCDTEQGSITLYAQWRKTQAILYIDPAGGTYEGSDKVTEISGAYGSYYEIRPDKVEAPMGATVTFETNGGEKVEPITLKQEFCEWSFRQPMQGKIENNIYTFGGNNGAIDYVSAVYQRKEILLPGAEKKDYSFGGWYYDKECTEYAGTAGDQFITTEDIILYAQWVELQLSSEDNYLAYGGKGAVDLMWSQADDQEKSYSIYQKREDDQWMKIYEADSISTSKNIHKEFLCTGNQDSYTIPYSGYYTLTLEGAQGKDYGSFHGGEGGRITAVIYFEKGEKINILIGGQDGYPGGGAATAYGNGGGYSVVSTEDRGILLIAGGGGGATLFSHGMPGGSLQGVIQDSVGQQGMAGGGGGYYGGISGNAVIHIHDEKCEHTHLGSPYVYGGCYTVLSVCNGTDFEEKLYKQNFYYGNTDEDGNLRLCDKCRSYECIGHSENYYQYICKGCKTIYENKKPSACTAEKRYELGCSETETCVCGYSNGQVIEQSKAYGGSNYANTAECITYHEAIGGVSGDGSLTIEADCSEFLKENVLKGVRALDCNAPCKIEEEKVQIKAVSEDVLYVIFDKPEDRGTVYYHKAESYDKESGQLVCTSNITRNILTSGIRGYRYIIDENTDTEVADENKFLVCGEENPYIEIDILGTKMYLHIAAEDMAGNRSETIHVTLDINNVEFGPIITEQMKIRSGSNVYPSDEIYYVKADGTTPFILSFDGVLLGAARKDYQLNQMHFCMQKEEDQTTEGILKLMVPMRDVISAGNYRYATEETYMECEGTFFAETASFTEVRRSDFNKRVSATQAFCLDEEMSGERIFFFPGAGVVTQKNQVLSERQQDIENGIVLIADGEAPAILGFELPESLITEAEWKLDMNIVAEDKISGLQELRAEIYNQNNGEKRVLTDEDGDRILRFTISSEDELHWGQFAIAVYAKDNVGNEAVVSYGMDSLSVTAKVTNDIEPDRSVFKMGECGNLYVQAIGYAEEVEILFPKEWVEKNPLLNKRFTYSAPEAVHAENMEFMIPLQIEEGEYVIIVRAHKEGKVTEAKPELLTVKVGGSILNEIRTRLR